MWIFILVINIHESSKVTQLTSSQIRKLCVPVPVPRPTPTSLISTRQTLAGGD